jgi:hypothetical protein
MTRRCKRITPLLGLLVLLALLAGCAAQVQGTKYTAFKDSTTALAQDTRTSYEAVQGLWDDLNAECLSVPSKKASYQGILSGKGIPCDVNASGQLVPFENPKPQLLGARLQALDSLVRYAAMLNVLATTDYAAGVDASTAKLAASLGNLQTALTPAVPAAAELRSATNMFSQVVGAVAKAYVEGKRKEALRTALTDTQASIKTLSEKLILDNGSVATLARGYSEKFVELAEETRPKDFEKRVGYDAKVLQKYKTGRTLAEALAALDKAVVRLPEAQAELLKSLDEPRTPLENLEAFVIAAEQAMAIVKQLKTL